MTYLLMVNFQHQNQRNILIVITLLQEKSGLKLLKQIRRMLIKLSMLRTRLSRKDHGPV